MAGYGARSGHRVRTGTIPRGVRTQHKGRDTTMIMDADHPYLDTSYIADAPATAVLAPDHHGHPFVTIDNERYYVVANVDRMPPFLMSIVSDGDRWMFLSSSGAVTAGRRNVDHALFPYETDDRLRHLGGLNGAATAIRAVGGDVDDVWRPVTGVPTMTRRRTLYKSVVGDSAIFEEHDEATSLTFRYRWTSSDRFGFVRTAELSNDGATRSVVEVRDGLRNILPHGLNPSIYLPMGNLANAYKRSELIDPGLRLAVYSLESLLTDRPEPAEALRATTTWSTGMDGASVSLRPEAAHRFDSLGNLGGSLVTGMPGAYFLCGTVELDPGASETWSIASDVGLDQPSVASLIRELGLMTDRASDLAASTSSGTQTLREIMATADALQLTGDELATAHHFSNVTYNVMRGGVPIHGYLVEMRDFAQYLERRHVLVADRHRDLLSALGPEVTRTKLLGAADRTADVDLQRLCREYLPFSFSRRHGDPSRPWNAFSIRTTDDDGNPTRYFEGNWRDIFQNWEAMSASFPEYLPDIVSAFVDASTPDGFNPYRITSDGIDWEVPEPDDPWSNIGYWGDHQIVYLLRLLKATDKYLPGKIRQLLGEARFTYADVPYRIAPYERIVEDPKATIDYDENAADVTAARVESVGSDGKLVWHDGAVYHVTLAEKLLVPALAKLSNFVPGGGIWMNTQRPEWNDANNALVGYGLSMVTLYQLQAYLAHIRRLVAGSDADVEMSEDVAEWLHATTNTLSAAPIDGEGDAGERERKQLMDALGRSFSHYRRTVYRDGFTGFRTVSLADVDALCDVAIVHLDATIATSRRDDGLYDSYNLIQISDDRERATVKHLGDMLEGQVAIIESGVLDADQCADIVDALFASAMFRPDQQSFMLYPARELPSFLQRNVLPPSQIDENPLLSELLVRGDSSVIVRDVDGNFRFNADLTTREALGGRLDRLAEDEAYRGLVHANGTATIHTYEGIFGHRSYTGRSGSMYGYEGIGSIYWHMVGKLLVAIQESTLQLASRGAPADAIQRLVAGYQRVRSGLSFKKTPLEHGAIPIDPYSHTPAHAGAQQPGMTGFVKEEILVRPAELGVIVDEGEILFNATFMEGSESLPHRCEWSVLDTSMEWRIVDLPAQSLGLSICQVPITVTRTEGAPQIEAELSRGEILRIDGSSLGRNLSSEIFARTGEVTSIRAFVPHAGERSKLIDQ
jgi:hypothetical protein